MLILKPWPHAKLRRFTEADVEMIRTGWVRAKSAGWSLEQWSKDIAAMYGVQFNSVKAIIYRKTYQFTSEG